MLSSLMPGLRDLRAPLAAGFVWLVALWFLFEPMWDRDREADGITGSANRLMSTLDLIGQGVVLSFAAYLIGAFRYFSSHGRSPPDSRLRSSRAVDCWRVSPTSGVCRWPRSPSTGASGLRML